MMYKKPSRRWVALKAAYLLPLGALSLVAFARPQMLTEIEEKVEEGVTHYAAIVSPSVSADTDMLPVETNEMPNQSVDIDDWETLKNGSVPADVNLVKADLKENPEASVPAPAMTMEYGAAVLDSVMQAVGARKIDNATFIGHFQPSLNNDTVRLAQVEILDKESQKTLEQTFPQNANDPYAYRMTLQAGTRKNETGYYIRYLTPIKATVRNYDHPKYDPQLLSTGIAQTWKYYQPAAIEQTKDETRIFMYVRIGGGLTSELLLQNSEFMKQWAIHDVDTDDKYMFRSLDNSYLRLVKSEVLEKDTVNDYQLCLVFPPLDKKVKQIWIGHVESHHYDVWRLKDIPRKARVITN